MTTHRRSGGSGGLEAAVALPSPTAGVVSAMRDLRYVATELKLLQSEELVPADTAETVLPELVRDTARHALGLPQEKAEAAEEETLLVTNGGGKGPATFAVENGYSASGLGLCLAAVAALIALDVANFVVMEIPPPVTWAVLLVMLSAAPLTHAAGTEMHDGYRFINPFKGGNTFCLLQGFGWTIYGFICLLVLMEALQTKVLCPVRARAAAFADHFLLTRVLPARRSDL